MASVTVRDQLARNHERLEQQIQDACIRAGRARSEVLLIAVTKYAQLEAARFLPERGILDLGENRPQQLWARAAEFPLEVRWHLIGQLQRNKVKQTLPLVHLIHSVDRRSLLETLEETAATLDRPVDVLLQVNTSGETTKSGWNSADLLRETDYLNTLHRVRIHGLMTLAALEDDPEKCRPSFIQLRQLGDELRRTLKSTHPLHQLSMGMSNDFQVAIEEGATMIRLGSALFEGLTV